MQLCALQELPRRKTLQEDSLLPKSHLKAHEVTCSLRQRHSTGGTGICTWMICVYCLDSVLSRNLQVLFAEAEGCRAISAIQEEKRLPCGEKC